MACRAHKYAIPCSGYRPHKFLQQVPAAQGTGNQVYRLCVKGHIGVWCLSPPIASKFR